MMEETIIAISTPPGFGGLGIIRLSGSDALPIALEMFRPLKKKPKCFPVRRVVSGLIIDRSQNEVIDEAMLVYFKAPHSYTREDVVELSCHGSPAVLERMVRLGIEAGARMASPGEFTLRAYLNGRLDIIQAQAVDDLIRSFTYTQARISIRQLRGSLSKKINRLKLKLIKLAAQVEAGLEFPDEGLKISPARHVSALRKALTEIDALISSYDAGRFIKQGLTVAIVGRKNAGKSTLFNALLEEDRAIVSPYPGTTRDYLREKLIIKDYVFQVVDMAGFGKALHPVEKLGMEKGWRVARHADGLLVVIDPTMNDFKEDLKIIEQVKSKKFIVVLNKIDLKDADNTDEVIDTVKNVPVIRVSALKKINITELKNLIFRYFAPSIDKSDEIIIHEHQKNTLLEIKGSLEKAAEMIKAGFSEELYAEEIRKSLESLGKMTGEVKSEDIIKNIFSRFCVGK